MWQTYYYKLIDSFCTPLFYLPRWFNSVGYPSLTDYIPGPPVSGFTSIQSGIVFTGTTLPSTLFLTGDTAFSYSPQIMQRFWNVFSGEKHNLFHGALSAYLSKAMLYDLSDPQFGWIVECLENADTVEVAREDGTYSTVAKALGDYDLFYSAKWKYTQAGNVVMLYGFDLRESSTEARAGSGWQFLKYQDWYSPTDMVYFRHPTSLNWVAIHPTNIRADGFINYISDAPLQIRAHVPSSTLAATSLQIRINNKAYVATRMNLTTSVDHKALLFNMFRKEGELALTLSNALLMASWFSNYTMEGTRNAISTRLRKYSFSSYPASPTSQFTIPASSTGYSIRGHQAQQYVTEVCIPDPNSNDRFISSYVDNSLGILFLNGRLTDYTVDGSGYIVPSMYTYNKVDVAVMRWKLNKWTQTGSLVQLSSAFSSNQSNISVLFPSAVTVEEADTKIKRKSILRTYPGYKWQTFSLAVNSETLVGLANFDF